jgi:flagellar protein FliO/FliZ
MDNETLLRAFLALVLVLGLIGLVARAARRFGLAPKTSVARNKRLTVLEITPLDAKNRLVLVRRDDIEHLLLVGSAQNLLIETVAGSPRPITLSDKDTP